MAVRLQSMAAALRICLLHQGSQLLGTCGCARPTCEWAFTLHPRAPVLMCAERLPRAALRRELVGARDRSGRRPGRCGALATRHRTMRAHVPSVLCMITKAISLPCLTLVTIIIIVARPLAWDSATHCALAAAPIDRLPRVSRHAEFGHSVWLRAVNLGSECGLLAAAWLYDAALHRNAPQALLSSGRFLWDLGWEHSGRLGRRLGRCKRWRIGGHFGRPDRRIGRREAW